MKYLKQLIPIAIWVAAILIGSHFVGDKIVFPVAVGLLLSKAYSNKECKDCSCEV